MSTRDLAAFGVDIVHILLLGIVYVVGLTVMTAHAYVGNACRNVRSTVNWRANGRHHGR